MFTFVQENREPTDEELEVLYNESIASLMADPAAGELYQIPKPSPVGAELRVAWDESKRDSGDELDPGVSDGAAQALWWHPKLGKHVDNFLRHCGVHHKGNGDH